MSLSSAFKIFTNERSTMDIQTYTQTLNDSGIYRFKITLQQTEQIFEKIKNNPNMRGINCQQFEACLSQISRQTGCTRQQIEGLVLEQGKYLKQKYSSPSKTTLSNIHSSPYNHSPYINQPQTNSQISTKY